MGLAPSTEATVFYAYSIYAGGKEIGHIQNLRTSFSQAITTYRGIDPDPMDLEANTELVPGHTDIILSIDRLETYSQNILEALGYEVGIRALLQNVIPFEIHEELESPRVSSILQALSGGLAPLVSSAGRSLLERIVQGSDAPDRAPSRLGVSLVYQKCRVQEVNKTVQVGTVGVAEGVTVKATNAILVPHSSQNATLFDLQNAVSDPLGSIIRLF